MKKIALSFLAVSAMFVSCSDDDNNNPNVTPEVTAPATYTFERNGATTVSYSGQTTRIEMGEELISALKDETRSEAQIDGMFAHVEGNVDFSDADLNASNKSIRSKTAASADYFASNTTDASAIKADFDTWIANQVNNVYPNWNNIASAGVAGQLQEAGGGSVRYINGKGLEYNQAVNKSLIGALMVDQMLNNYLSPSVLDAGNNIADNDNDVVAEGKNYTTMEHKWDEAFGYLYGTDNAVSPLLNQDSFLNKYLSRVENDTDYTGIADRVYDAFKLGRAAIVAKDYDLRDEQAQIIREEISKVIAVRVIYYLQQGKLAKNGGDMAAAFHDFSEGFGFIYSLQFTRQPNTNVPYFTKSEVDAYIDELMEGNGFWDVTDETLDTISSEVADAFGLSVVEAGS
ncbi:DUF4856 domain-containing protein [Psychroserpens sp.]|uniref:DUF4856 domain-containing protein n=1 Tax=Psychroserpens sp. TaxID=2020870 RepID=UPI001B1DBE67|nr:DUF4856 domain-containing protein [Psychroserpens sp.]MBO6607214.1 DUF4856 domain-containing protein [Psychroserpens sp.]MBO6632576.1 DUF4856 domain-containing protein [Psychroserpens sp.]MBO6654360.1 DUF4856 domain-containing protein [Psychroserpens sp.]MBO6682354.1 DUF4856 domain-containing protein [Psychroserpens sp.]MBO6750986.1 DUF4856 domain-containing protein [Psychroserpens sp.]